MYYSLNKSQPPSPVLFRTALPSQSYAGTLGGIFSFSPSSSMPRLAVYAPKLLSYYSLLPWNCCCLVEDLSVSSCLQYVGFQPVFHVAICSFSKSDLVCQLKTSKEDLLLHWCYLPGSYQILLGIMIALRPLAKPKLLKKKVKRFWHQIHMLKLRAACENPDILTTDYGEDSRNKT